MTLCHLRTRNIQPTRNPDRIVGEWLEFDLKCDPFEGQQRVAERMGLKPMGHEYDLRYYEIMEARK